MATSELRAKRIVSVLIYYSLSGIGTDHCGLAFRLEELFDPPAYTNPVDSTTHEVHLFGELHRRWREEQAPSMERSTRQAQRPTKDKLPNDGWDVSHSYGQRMKKPAAWTGVGSNDLWPLSA